MTAEVKWVSPSGGPDGRTGTLATLVAGTRVGKYVILAVLGQGGFGITYRAHDTQLDRDVAVKEYLPTAFAVREPDSMVLPRSTHVAEDFRWGRERFLAEARTLAHLEHAAGVVDVHDFLEANGTAYMVMGLVRGETLESRLRRERALPQAAIERFLPPLLDGLEKVHAADFLHRDIKPANILIDTNGQPTLIDFGASRAALQGRTQALTAVYTPGYAAFEQFTSARQGPWTDIYALGATLYHCITGAPPPSAADRMRDDTLVPALEAGKGRYAPSLLAAIDAALRLRDSERPQTIPAWRHLLSSGPPSVGLAPDVMATRRLDSAQPMRRANRRRWPLWIGAAVLALCLGGGLYLWQQDSRDAQAWSRATTAKTTAAYRDYLTAHPAGRHAAEARQAMADLEADERAWAQAVAAHTEDSYRDYLKARPGGIRAAEARKVVADLEARRLEAARRAEDAAWTAAKAANTTASLRAYLERYPSGRYAAEARNLIAVMERAEDETWTAAKTANTAASLQAYLEKYPRGRYATEARNLIAAIERREQQPQGHESLAAINRDVERLPEIVRSCQAIRSNIARIIFISLNTLDVLNRVGSPEARRVSKLPAFARDPITLRPGGFTYQFGSAKQPVYVTAPEYSWDQHPARQAPSPQPFWAYMTSGIAVFDVQAKDVGQFRVVLSRGRRFSDPPFKPYPDDVVWTPGVPLQTGTCTVILYQYA